MKYTSQSNIRPVSFAIFFIVIAFFSSCSQNKQDENNTEKNVSAVIPPTSVLIKDPIVVNLDTCPAPQQITIPIKSPSSYTKQTKKGPKVIKLLPPINAPAGFYTKMKNYNTEDGLNISAFGCGYKDRDGNMWFGSYGGGVSRYDGKTFTGYTTAHGLADNLITCILQDRNGNMWFGTPGNGVSKYDGRSFTNMTIDQGLIDNNIYCITQDKDGDIWFATSEGASRYNGKTFKNYTTEKGLPDNIVTSIINDDKGNLWFGTGKGISYYDGRIFTNYSAQQGFIDGGVSCIAEDKNGNLWIGTYASEIFQFDGRTFTNYKFNKGTIECITVDRNENIWFGTKNEGAIFYDGKTFTDYSEAQGLANNIVNSITEDNNGNIWFSTYGGGISRFDGKSFSNFTTAQGLSDDVIWTIVEDKLGNIWFGNYKKGITCYDGKSFTTYSTEQGLVDYSTWSSTMDKNGDLWFGTDLGASRYDGKSFTNYTPKQGLPDNSILNIKEDSRGNMWFGTDGSGVFCFNGKSFTNYNTTHGLANDHVYGIAEDSKGNLWFGTDGGGVSCFDGRSFTNYTKAQGLVSDNVYSVLKDKNGNLWFGTFGSGISRYDGKSFLNLTSSDGLADDNVTQLSEDKNGAIWIATNWGFSKLNFKLIGSSENEKEAIIPGNTSLKNEELKNYTPAFETYNQRTGYPVKDINVGQNCMFIDSKGIIWGGTGDVKTALVRFDPSLLNHRPDPPVVMINSIKINDENISWYGLQNNNLIEQTDSASTPPNIIEEVNGFGRKLTETERATMRKRFQGITFDSISRFYPLPKNLVLPFDHNNITFEFNAIEPARSFLVNYQYILEGYDNDWSRITNKSTATFGNIYEGNYTFKVKAQSPEGIWSEPITYAFKVLPPWYRTWWMYTIDAIAAFLLLFIIYRWRTASLRKDKDRLEQIVQERTTEVIQQKEEVEEKQREILDSIHYAKKIQEALLGEEEHVSMHLPSHFILFKPKDIISGDFYWSQEKQNHLYFAAADCTGHGVPGAMMSMLGIAFLNEITSSDQLLSPAEILNKLRDKVVTELGSSGQTKDGMDISLCKINLKTFEVEWAGANNPLWLIKNDKGKKTLIEVKADKQTIGYNENYKPYTNHSFNERNCTYYLFTDGYADQFGGARGKKFMYKPLKERLLLISDKPMEDQKAEMIKAFDNWKGELAQVDDVCLIGIRIA